MLFTKRFKEQVLITLSSIATIGAIISVSSVFAAPSQTPPNETIDPILNIGSTPQTKTGPLTINNTATATTHSTSQLNSTTLCLNGDCRSSWPGGSSYNPTFDSVLSNGSQLQYRSAYFNNGVALNGVYRSSWPSWSFTTPIYAHYPYQAVSCPYGTFVCGAQNTWDAYIHNIACCYARLNSF